ncbi:hypothetical protein AcW2_006758 [Taiwanofungus camphoratus]|nr:hypothetical protein AcW2_006758 [Antrodia cinnamomea]
MSAEANVIFVPEGPMIRVEQSGTLASNDSHVSNDSKNSTNEPGQPSKEQTDSHQDEQALEWHEVIELQAFSERKAWIEDKIKFLERLPPIEVFVGLDAVRSSAYEVPGLPTRGQLQEWIAEHDRIEKETEIFDSGELKKLKKLTKAAAQRNLSPADTDLIELTLTTIYELDKLLHLLRDRSENLDLLGTRLTWEERRIAGWRELNILLTDIRNYLTTRARWSPAVYDAAVTEDEPTHEPELKRRNSVVSITSMASDSSYLSAPGYSRGARFKLTELLSRDAAQFASRISSLRHMKIAGAGKALDKLIDNSRKPVPDELLDEQDKLENHGINEMEDVAKFIMNVVMQWKKADEIYIETLKDKAAAQTLLEEIELARSRHPTSRQDAAFLSRANALVKRLFTRGDPALSTTALLRPVHPLFPDQQASNEATLDLLSSEMCSATDQARKAEFFAKEYHLTFEAVKRVETACKTASDLSSRLISLVERLEKGIETDRGGGTPPDLETEACLESTRHAVFLTMLPSTIQELEEVHADGVRLLPSARAALLHLDRPGVDPQFKIDSESEIERLVTCQHAALRTQEWVMAHASTLEEVRRLWSVMAQLFKELQSIQSEVIDNVERRMWRQQVRPHDAPPTPESPTTALPPPLISPVSVLARLIDLQERLHQEVSRPLTAVLPLTGMQLREYLTHCSTELATFHANTSQVVHFWEAVQKQADIMGIVRDEVHGLQVQMEDLKVRFEKGVRDVLAGVLSGDGLLLTEGGLASDLKRSQETVRAFIDDLHRRVPFVNQAHLTRGATDHASQKRRCPITTNFTLDVVRHAASLHIPFDSAALDHVVRADLNAYSMMLSGTVKILQQKADHFQLAKIAQTIDVAIASAVDNIRRGVEAVDLIWHSLTESNSQPTLEHLNHLSKEVERLLQTDGPAIMQSFTPIHELVHRLRSASEGFNFISSDNMINMRRNAVEDAEFQHETWKQSIRALQQKIVLTLQAEQARLTEEKERSEADGRAKVDQERLEDELRARAEPERLEEEGLATDGREHQQRDEKEKVDQAHIQAEEREIYERERLWMEEEASSKQQSLAIEELEKQASPRGRGASSIRETCVSEDQPGVGLLLEPVEESDLENSMIYSKQDPEVVEDVFGLRIQPSAVQVNGQQRSDLQARIFSLRKLLRSINISELVRPNAHSDFSLPSDEQRKRVQSHLLAIIAEVDGLPVPTPEDPSVETELRSLRSEVSASIEWMQKVHQLADLSITLYNCDNALSDLLEHIDSYPSPPLGPLSTSHTSDPALTPEEQLSARLLFTKTTIRDMSSRYSSAADDPRAAPERDRILQTWSELEAMSMDRINGQRSRPGSVISSGRSSRASAMTSSTSAKKKTGTYAKLSVGSSGDRFLAPPPLNSRRSVSGSSTGHHGRSSSRMSITSSSRSVSGPISNSSSLHSSTFSSRQRTTSVSSTLGPIKSPLLKQPQSTPARPRAQTGQSKRTASPVPSDASSISVSRSGFSANRSSNSRSSWARAPRTSFPTLSRPSTPRNKATMIPKKPYIANPKNKLDVAVGHVVNRLPVNINVEVVADTWKDQSGKYWIGDQDPKLCFCRILRSHTVMVRVGGGWSELSKFIKDHFAEAFRMLPESPPRPGTREEKWISSTTLSQAAENIVPFNPSRTPEPKSPFIPSFALSTPSGTSPHSLKSSPSPGSPLTPLQFLRRAERESPSSRSDTPSKILRPGISTVLNTPARPPVWRP